MQVKQSATESVLMYSSTNSKGSIAVPNIRGSEEIWRTSLGFHYAGLDKLEEL